MSKSLPLSGCHILVIEDEYFIGMELDRLLTEAGAEVVGPIGDLERAMAQVKRDGFCVALLDVRLRDGLIYEIADELSRQNLPFLFATGYDKVVIPSRFSDVKCWQKPLSGEKLVTELASICHRVKASSALAYNALH